MLDILCVSDMCVDLVLSGNVRPRFGQQEQIIGDYLLELGGSANIFASQFVKLGGSAGVIGRVGNDPFGKLILERLQSIGVDISFVRTDSGMKTGLGVALAEPNDRAILTYPATIDAVRASDLTDEMLKACRHWHIASFFLLTHLEEHWVRWLQRCKKNGLTTSLDTNWDPENEWKGVTDLLPLIDVLLPNEAEAQSITGEKDVCLAGRRLARKAKLVVVKCGAQGAMAFQGDGMWELPVPSESKPRRIVDSVGAGDNFDAGFLRNWLSGQKIEECLALGCRCGAASLGAAGGIEGQLRMKLG